jgi:conjugative transfer region protein TrbK
MPSQLTNFSVLGRAVGFAAVAILIVAAAVHLLRNGVERGLPPLPTASYADALSVALARCQDLGMAAENDAACQSAWAENRRRFFADIPPAKVR